MAGLNTSLVSAGLPTITADPNATQGGEWATSAYLLALAAAVPACSWRQRRWGASRVQMVPLVVFAASALCTLAPAPNSIVLILARVLQGAAGGIMVPTGQTSGLPLPDRQDDADPGPPADASPRRSAPRPAACRSKALSWQWLFPVNREPAGTRAHHSPKDPQRFPHQPAGGKKATALRVPRLPALGRDRHPGSSPGPAQEGGDGQDQRRSEQRTTRRRRNPRHQPALHRQRPERHGQRRTRRRRECLTPSRLSPKTYTADAPPNSRRTSTARPDCARPSSTCPAGTSYRTASGGPSAAPTASTR